ncbi:hypothetical protein SRO_6939 [Streptomyces rochei]|nr:hypothetical protein SRO_6939 [Streptomyces rochei]
MLGEAGGLDTHLGQHLGDRVLAFAEQFQYADTGGMTERLSPAGSRGSGAYALGQPP